MPRGLTEKQKEELKASFIAGKNIEDLVQYFCFSKLTIIRNLKKILGENQYKNLLENQSLNKREKVERTIAREPEKSEYSKIESGINRQNNPEEFTSQSHFLELTPMDFEIDVDSQKDISSIPLTSIEFPKIVYMVVDKNIELQTKILNDYPEWRFFPEKELKRKTIEIFLDPKNAKKNCNKEQKVIKVPNPNVFMIVAPMLISRGISRIVSEDQLISL